MTFQRGDILTSDRFAQPFFVFLKYNDQTIQVMDPDGCEFQTAPGGMEKYEGETYDGEPYGNAGRVFMPSGEFRKALNGEFCLLYDTVDRKHTSRVSDRLSGTNISQRIIVLPVPDLTEEVEKCHKCGGAGELLIICDACDGGGEHKPCCPNCERVK